MHYLEAYEMLIPMIASVFMRVAMLIISSGSNIELQQRAGQPNASSQIQVKIQISEQQ